ncbi:MAG TPA: response regulator [Thermoanaerobaculia bacterium]|nr:response regulator [Thermoanaerobaculia bacterium]
MAPCFLVVDDDDGIRRLVSTVLRRQKYEIDDARDGGEAISKLANGTYDGLFLDLMMPICNGYEVLAFMREQQIDRKCVVVMTAAGTRGTKELDLTLVHRVLHKPFDIADILAAAAEVLAAR